MKRLLSYIIFLVAAVQMSAQTYSISGLILDKTTKQPVEFATIALTKTEQWAVADANGNFTIENVQPGLNEISISCLGYVTDTREINITKDIPVYQIYLQQDNLTLESVVVTAKGDDNTATTNHTIDKTALDHIQMMNVADVSSLLPGGSTTNPSILDEMRFNIRAGGAFEKGNPTFGTAVEVDGVRISNNASFGDNGLKGAVTNNIASSNVESIEIITGVPSVEYGDMTSGVVKINTQKGVTPYTISFSTNPNTKQASFSKGFSLGSTKAGKSNGFLNANLEYTKSVRKLMSPYDSYDRKQVSLTYSNLFSSGFFAKYPLRFNIGATGNLGGRNTDADPDKFMDSYERTRDNVIRGNFSLNWLLSKKWITSIDLSGAVSYSDKQYREKIYKSRSSWTPVLHGTEEGYFIGQLHEDNPDAEILMIPSGYYNYVMVTDDKPLNYSIKLKALWARQFGKINNKVKLGADWEGSGNFGVGLYSEDLASTMDSFREYRYCDVPFMNNLAVYLEDNITIPIGKTRLNLIAGVRNDNTFIKGSLYGGVSSWSPRFNALYTVFSPKDRHRNTVKALSFRASWGVATKLPSNSVLYPVPAYNDILTFTSTSAADGRAFSAYYILPRTIEYNRSLKWQKSRTAEVGMDIDIDGYRISLAGYYTQTLDAYRISDHYTPFSYNFTDTKALSGIGIPEADRLFEVDRNTGIVTVHDKTNALPSETLAYTTKHTFSKDRFASNFQSPMTRYGLEWTIDFKKIRPINTTIRLDGSFYGYRYVDSTVEEYYPEGNSTDGSPFKYVGFYYGGHDLANGYESRNIKTNLTITTHIPKVRMIISLRLEAYLMSYSRYLSERADGSARSHVISDKNDILSMTDASIYDGDNFTVLFPDKYISHDDPTPRDFMTDLLWAKDNDPNKYNDLAKFAHRTNFIYHFGEDWLSPYFSANLSITKEIGDIASISFYANNFFNNTGQVYHSKSKDYENVKRLIANFYYGLSLRLKF